MRNSRQPKAEKDITDSVAGRRAIIQGDRRKESGGNTN